VATLRFTRDQLVEALEARRPWAEKVDADRLTKHQKAEQDYLRQFRAACREAVKWDYEEAKKHSFSPWSGRQYRPDCPRSLVVALDMHLRMVRATRQDRFAVSEDGTWSKVFYLLTHDEDAKAEMC
jgi:hypothetical protein